MALWLLVGCGETSDAPSPGAGRSEAGHPTLVPEAGTDAARDAAPAAGPEAGAPRDAATAPVRDAGPADAGPQADATYGVDAAALIDAQVEAGAIDAGAGYSACPGDGACKILPLGDSITYGLGYAGGYRVELFRKARADMKRVTFVGSVQNGPTMVDGEPFPRRNEGHSGWTIEQIAGLVPDPALDDPPHIVLLMAGTNDVNLSRDLANAPKRLGALIDALVSANADALIVVAQITPLSRASGALDTFNAALPAVVSARAQAGKHVLLVDMNTDFPDGALGDGVHPNQKGYEWMAGVWYRAIAASLR